MKYRFKFNGIIELDGEFLSGEDELKKAFVGGLTLVTSSDENQNISASEKIDSLVTNNLNPYFKYLNTLIFEGNKIRSSKPVFSESDQGKEFCGLFAHQNSELPEDDLFWPGILGSRYAKILAVNSPTEIVTDFSYSGQSNFGYIFYDNSSAFYKLLQMGGVIHLPKGTVVMPELRRIDLLKDTFLIGHPEGTDLMFGYEDYFFYSTHKRRRFDTVLFDFDDRSINFASVNVNFLPPFRIIKCTEPYFSRLFSNMRKSTQKIRVAVINCDTTKNQRNPQCNSFGFGLGVIYDSDNVFYLKNFKHRGGSFTDFKVPEGRKLWLVLDNVETDFIKKEDFQTAVFPCKIRLTKERGVLPFHNSYPTHVAETLDSSFYFFLNQFYARGWNNFFNIIHIDRFVFYLPTAQFFKNIYDPLFGGYSRWHISDVLTQTMTASRIMLFHIPQKGRKYWVQRSSHDTVRTFVNWCEVQNKPVEEVRAPENGYPVELQPGDIFELAGEKYRVQMKERGDFPNMPNGYQNYNRSQESQYIFSNCKLDTPLPTGDVFEITIIHSCSEYLLDEKERPAYFIYKGNSQIALTEDSKFGGAQILYTAGMGHLSYNHKEIGIWARNTKHQGFYRQSSGTGKSPGYFIINSTGFENEFNPDEMVQTQGDLPTEVSEYLELLRGLQILIE